MENTLNNRIVARADELGMSLEAISLKAGLDRSYLRKLIERAGASPRGETMNKLAAALEVAPAWFLSDAQPTPTSDVSPANVPAPQRGNLPNNVPVLGTAAGSHLRGAFQMTTDPVDWVRRPQTLFGAKDVYAVYVEGNSMEPQFFPGDLIFVHPHRPPRFGDPVIVQSQNGSEDAVEATLGILHKRTAETLVIRKHNPSAEVSIKRDRIISTHKVLTNNDLYGV